MVSRKPRSLSGFGVGFAMDQSEGAKRGPDYSLGVCRIYREAVTGLSPGFLGSDRPPVHPEGVSDRGWETEKDRVLLDVVVHGIEATNLSPLQGGAVWYINPGLKPWAKSCNRFAVNPTDTQAIISSAPNPESFGGNSIRVGASRLFSAPRISITAF
jgi:hypothetical protein